MSLLDRHLAVAELDVPGVGTDIVNPKAHGAVLDEGLAASWLDEQ
jgi:hypothetical protein